ncbi:hypothetical protein ACJMK2_042248 [Sinanodonta woodiana]|uniref:NACHT domain-containing protein n=1 Tax=Sinanodonta woodiana TaxID=1069815 RepID=A0ABD3W7S2_SINWO
MDKYHHYQSVINRELPIKTLSLTETSFASRRKMRKVSSVEYHAVHVLLAYLSVSVLISLTFGSLDSVSESMCEYEDANLIWRNAPTYSLSDVKAMAWYKGKGSLIATWLEGKEFMEYHPYIGRLMQIGETGIKIRTANRSDSGIYWLSLTLASVDRKLEAATYLEVKVAPSKLCKPKITQEGPLIKADLPPEDCGIPHLRTKWKRNNMIITQENSSSFLDTRTDLEPGEYVACAEGESATCYKGNISDLCSTHTIPTSHHVLLVIGIPLLIVVVMTAIIIPVLVLCIRRIRGRKPTGGHVERSAEKENITDKEQKKSNNYEMSTIADAPVEILKAEQPKTKRRVMLSDIKKYLKGLYEGLVTVPLSPVGEGDNYANISDVYVNIALNKVEISDLNDEESNVSYGTRRDNEPLIYNKEVPRNNKNQFSPILIFGDCGSGKSTWCKHLVQSWLLGADIKDNNIGLILPKLKKIKILLYLPLQFSDRGISFKDLLKKHIFKEIQSYLDFVMNYVKTNSQEVLLVMDGLDIIQENIKSILDILRNKRMSLSTVILTSRPASLKLLQDSCHVKIEQLMLYRVCKMTPEESMSYASNVLDYINRLHSKNFKFVNFWRFTKQLHVNDLLNVPYICLVLLHVWMKNETRFIEITDILFDIVRFYLHRATSDQQRKKCIEDASDIRSTNVHNDMTIFSKWNVQNEHIYILHSLSRIAAQIIFSQVEREPIQLNVPQIFSISDEDDSDLQCICETGLLTEPLSLSADTKISDMSFPDRLILEFFVSMFIALRKGKDCDFVLSRMTASVENSMILHILYQLSDTLTNKIIHKAIKKFRKENTTTMGEEKHNDLNEKCRFFITSNKTSPVIWLKSLMCNDALNASKLLFLSTTLQCIDTITTLELTNNENNVNLVFQLPFLPVLKILTLDINNCTLLLCKEWGNNLPCELKQVVIKSVNINCVTLSVLNSTLSFCAGLEKMELCPSVVWMDDDINVRKRTDVDSYSWNKLSKHIENYTKLKILELQNLILPGEVETLLSRLNRYQNLEILTLTNVSSTSQERPSLSPSCYTDKDDDVRPYTKVNLTELSLEKLKLKQSPFDVLFNPATNGKPIENNINKLSITALELPETLWATLGSQIGNLSITEFNLSNVNPGDYLQNLLDGISESKTLDHLSLSKIGTGKMIPSFTFLHKMRTLSQLKLRYVKLDGSSARSLFKEICECKQLQNLSLCNIDVEELPETLTSVQTLTKLSELTVYKVKITEGSQSLTDILNAFSKCESLQTIYVSKDFSVCLPSISSSTIKVIYLDII